MYLCIFMLCKAPENIAVWRFMNELIIIIFILIVIIVIFVITMIIIIIIVIIVIVSIIIVIIIIIIVIAIIVINITIIIAPPLTRLSEGGKPQMTHKTSEFWSNMLSIFSGRDKIWPQWITFYHSCR